MMTKNRYAGPWAYIQGNKQNPYNGEIRSASGELLILRAVMNEEDAAFMKLMAAAPDLLAALRAYVEHDEKRVRRTYRDGCIPACAYDRLTPARAAIARAER